MMNNVALVLQAEGKLDESRKLHEETLALRQKVLHENHPRITSSLNNLASVLMDEGDLEEAERLFHESLEMKRRLLGEDHPKTLDAIHNLALVIGKRGGWKRQRQITKELLDARRATQGDDHPDTIQSINFWMALSESLGNPLEAIEFWSELEHDARSTGGSLSKRSTSRTPPDGDKPAWRVIPNETEGDEPHANFRGTGYIQVLPDHHQRKQRKSHGKDHAPSSKKDEIPGDAVEAESPAAANPGTEPSASSGAER